MMWVLPYRHESDSHDIRYDCSVSPGADRVVVVDELEHELQLWAIDRAQNDKQPVSRVEARCTTRVVWSPDGRRVAFGNRRLLCMWDLADQLPGQPGYDVLLVMPTDIWDLAWGGRRIALSTATSGWRYSVDDRRLSSPGPWPAGGARPRPRLTDVAADGSGRLAVWAGEGVVLVREGRQQPVALAAGYCPLFYRQDAYVYASRTGLYPDFRFYRIGPDGAVHECPALNALADDPLWAQTSMSAPSGRGDVAIVHRTGRTDDRRCLVLLANLDSQAVGWIEFDLRWPRGRRFAFGWVGDRLYVLDCIEWQTFGWEDARPTPRPS